MTLPALRLKSPEHTHPCDTDPHCPACRYLWVLERVARAAMKLDWDALDSTETNMRLYRAVEALRAEVNRNTNQQE